MTSRASGFMRGQVLAGHRQHAAGARRRVVDRAHDAGLGQRVVVFDEQQVDHQPDDFARGEVLPGRLVGEFGELADQLLEHRAHLGVADDVGVQVDVGELLGHQVQQPGLGEPVDLGVEVEALEDVAHGGRERLHVGAQVLADVVLVAHQLLHVERRRVVEELAGLAEQERLGVQAGLLRLRPASAEHGGLVGSSTQSSRRKHGERQDDLAVFGLLVVAAQQVGDGPDEAPALIFERRPAFTIGGTGPYGHLETLSTSGQRPSHLLADRTVSTSNSMLTALACQRAGSDSLGILAASVADGSQSSGSNISRKT